MYCNPAPRDGMARRGNGAVLLENTQLLIHNPAKRSRRVWPVASRPKECINGYAVVTFHITQPNPAFLENTFPRTLCERSFWLGIAVVAEIILLTGPPQRLYCIRPLRDPWQLVAQIVGQIWSREDTDSSERARWLCYRFEMSPAICTLNP
ncbi:hypothetical protein VTK73DRAFT_223 [Phialemonium thermophilum]|uniref:Uncharacterized protein n=1 Tax=Phialemonium thermophilum TaxID=223376 RepID=A0ABR3XFL9_9PEZI